MIINRIADIFFILGICSIFLSFKTTNFLIIFNLVPFIQFDTFIFCGFTINLITLICFFFTIGAIGKSAQLGLHIRLPDAMEGPTPVSSLLHAATMVTAGVFLPLRCSIFLEYSGISLFIILLGAITSFVFALIGIFQYDIKKIIAYSTVVN